MGREAWWATVHRVPESQTRPSTHKAFPVLKTDIQDKIQMARAHTHTDTHASIQRNKRTPSLTHKSGRSPTTPLSNKAPQSDTKQIGLFQRKGPKRREKRNYVLSPIGYPQNKLAYSG